MGWYNVDLHAQVVGVGQMDATQRFPYPDETFDRIFTEHMIEHVSYEAGGRMLAECHRVLKPGGRIRVSTPNLMFLVSLLNLASDLERRYVAWACEEFLPGQTAYPESVVNNFVRAWGHQYIHTPCTLDRLLRGAGFTVNCWPHIGESDDPEFRELENVGRMPEGFLQLETMTVEADK